MVLLSDDKANRERAIREGISALSCREYAASRGEALGDLLLPLPRDDDNDNDDDDDDDDDDDHENAPDRPPGRGDGRNRSSSGEVVVVVDPEGKRSRWEEKELKELHQGGRVPVRVYTWVMASVLGGRRRVTHDDESFAWMAST